MQSDQIVFYFLKGVQYRLAVVGDTSVVAGDGRVSRGAASARIEECLREAPTDSPKTTWPIEPVQQGRTFETSRRGNVERWIVRCLCNSDLLVCCRHATLGSCDVRTAFEQWGRQGDGNHWEDGRFERERCRSKAEFG